MAHSYIKYIDCLFPFILGFFALIFPQKLTKINLQENPQLKKRLNLAGWMGLTFSVLLLICHLLG